MVKFTYLGSIIATDGDIQTDINMRLAKVAVFRRLGSVWKSRTLSQKIELQLYSAVVVSTAIYASKTWKSTAHIQNKLDVFHRRNLRKIIGVTWKDKMTNTEVLVRTNHRRMKNIVAERRPRCARHIIRMAPERPARNVMDWIPVDGKRGR